MLLNSSTQNRSGYRAVLFDMDGVLVEARDWHYQALNQALAAFGYAITRDEHELVFNGLPTRKKLEILASTRGFPMTLADPVNRLKQQMTLEYVYAACCPDFSKEYMLAKLTADGYKLGVVSNSIRQSIEVILERSGIAQRFDLVISNEDVTQPKPDPEMYLLAMDRLGVRPSDCLVVEDNENGIAAARSAGASVLAVSGPEDVNYRNLVRALTRPTPALTSVIK